MIETKFHNEKDVVPADIPPLLSKASMKRAGTVLDMENDRAVMFNKPVTPKGPSHTNCYTSTTFPARSRT